MTQNNHEERVWEIIAKAGICMMTTQSSGGSRAADGGATR